MIVHNHPAPTVGAPVTLNGHDEIKARHLLEAGLVASDLSVDLDTLTAGETRKAIAEHVLTQAGFHAAEIRGLMSPDAQHLDVVAPELAIVRFERALRRVKAGLKVLPQEVLDALDADMIVRVGMLSGEVRRALGNPRSIGIDAAQVELAEGRLVLTDTQRRAEEIVRSLPKDVRKDALVFSQDRLIFEAILASNLTPERLVMALPKASLHGDVLVARFGEYGEAHLDFAAGSINGAVIREKVRCFDTALTPAQVLAFFALGLDGVTRLSTAQAKLEASAPSIFLEPEYDYTHHAVDSRADLMKTYRLGFLALKMSYGSLSTFELSDNRTTEEVVAGAEFMAQQGYEICIDKVSQNVLYGDGARAALFGRKVDDKGEVFVVNNHDASKPEKDPNRFGLTKPTARTFDPATGAETTTASGLKVVLRDGTLAVSYGTKIRTLIGNGFGFGSGPMLVREDFLIGVLLGKGISAQLNGVYLEEEIAAIEKAHPGISRADALELAAKAKLEVNREELRYGDWVLKYDGTPIALWEGLGISGQVVGEPTFQVMASSETVTIAIKTEARYIDGSHKTTTDGLKTVTHPFAFTAFDTNGNPIACDALANCEVIKGLPTLLVKAWADTIPGGITFDPNTGLTPAQEVAFLAWVAANTKTVRVPLKDLDPVDVCYLKTLVAKAKADPAWAADESFNPDAYEIVSDTEVVITTEAVEADLVVGVEVSTTRENMGYQPAIAEQMMVFKAIEPTLAAGLWEDAGPVRMAIHALLRNAVRPNGGVFEMNADAPVLDHDKSLKGRALIKHYAKEFPGGLTFKLKDKARVTVDFGALVKLGAFAPGGSATGLSLAVVELLDFLHVSQKGKKSWTSHIGRKLGKVSSALLAWGDSAGPLGKVTKSGKVLAGGKIRTTLSNAVKAGEIGMNPNDPRVLDGTFSAGDKALVGRSPMVSVFGGVIVLTEEAAIGCFLVKARLWAYGNEGDADGDPAYMLLLAKFDDEAEIHEVADRILTKLETSLFGPTGYVYAHDRAGYDDPSMRDITKDPYADFFLGNEKKNPRVLKNTKHEPAVRPLATYLDNATGVGEHYTFFVGKTFAIVSYLTYLLGRDMEQGRDTANLERACVVAWRILYEGLGLAGFTPKAKTFRKQLGELFRSNRVELNNTQAKTGYDNDLVVESITDPKTGEKSYFATGLDGFKLVWFLATGRKDEEAVMGYLYNAVLVTGVYSTLERELEPGKSPEQVLAENKLAHAVPALDHALIFGTLRRGSKGLAISAAMGEDEDNLGLYTWVEKRPHLKDMAGNGMVREMLDAVVSVQAAARTIRTRQAAQAQYGF